MMIQYVSQDLEWTESMKGCVQKKIIAPLAHVMNSDDFEISIHLDLERKRVLSHPPKLEMWIVLQTFDGQANEVVRDLDENFLSLVHQLSTQMRWLRPRYALQPVQL